MKEQIFDFKTAAEEAVRQAVKDVLTEQLEALQQSCDKVATDQPDQEWVRKVERLYREALNRPYIKKPLAWALYQVWREYDSTCSTREVDR